MHGTAAFMCCHAIFLFTVHHEPKSANQFNCDLYLDLCYYLVVYFCRCLALIGRHVSCQTAPCPLLHKAAETMSQQVA